MADSFHPWPGMETSEGPWIDPADHCLTSGENGPVVSFTELHFHAIIQSQNDLFGGAGDIEAFDVVGGEPLELEVGKSMPTTPCVCSAG